MQIHKQWDFHHSEENQSIYQRVHDQYKLYFSTTKGRYTIVITSGENDWTDTPPTGDLPIIQLENEKFEIQNEHRHRIPISVPVQTWDDFVAELSEYDRIMLQHTTILKPIELLHALEAQTEFYVCSYGALKDNESGGGFLIADKNEVIYVTGYNPDTGHNYFQSSYRSEAQAGYTVFLFLQMFCRYQGIEQPTIKFYCDNKGLIMRLANTKKLFTTQ